MATKTKSLEHLLRKYVPLPDEEEREEKPKVSYVDRRSFLMNRRFHKLRDFVRRHKVKIGAILAFKAIYFSSLFYLNYASWKNQFFMLDHPVMAVASTQNLGSFIFYEGDLRSERKPDYVFKRGNFDKLRGPVYSAISLDDESFVLKNCETGNIAIALSPHYDRRKERAWKELGYDVLHLTREEFEPLLRFYQKYEGREIFVVKEGNDSVNLEKLRSCLR